MLPRAAPRPRAGACTLESSLRCLRTSDHLVLRGGVANSRKSTSPRRCWTGASRAGICLPRGAHAAPGCPEASSRRLHPGVLPKSTFLLRGVAVFYTCICSVCRQVRSNTPVLRAQSQMCLYGPQRSVRVERGKEAQRVIVRFRACPPKIDFS